MEEIKEMTKPSYEDLEVQYKKTLETARLIQDKNEELREINKELINRLNFNEIGFVFKALELRELFSKEFVDKCVKRLEEILMPKEEEEEK